MAVLSFQAAAKRQALLRLRQNELDRLEKESALWIIFWKGCASGKRCYSLSCVAAYVGLYRDHPRFCQIVAHCAPEWLGILGWDGEDKIGPHHLSMLIIELGAYELISPRASSEFGDITLSETTVLGLEETATVSDAGALNYFRFKVMERWCDRRLKEKAEGS
ncbi:hypothetical protein [Sphingomonas sp.]|uniref:hypothetical protein n=1 Tax=Sphingomonas sp. TaxID=28214 RepID=UPI0025E185F2|nr:hypothetical protein [Sphingomonas sp.]